MNISQSCLNGCLQGDRNSQKEFYDTALPYFNAICHRYLKNSSLRQDVLQDAFVSIFNKIHQYNPERGALHSWGAKIVINHCFKQNQKEGRFIEWSIRKHEKGADPEVMKALGEADLESFLKTMPEKYYDVFMLFVVEGFSHEEISAIIGIKEEVCRKRLSRARLWLQAELKKADSFFWDMNYKIS
jgi:RNA polymerase sigma-70 factor (ECF subfamily)